MIEISPPSPKQTPKARALTERNVQDGLYWYIRNTSIVCPNYTPRDWWEADVFSVIPAGYTTKKK